jgi:hypothetical protein
MKVIDHEPHWWFLLEEDGALIVDVNCNVSFFGYSFAMQMNPDEVAQYQSKGRSYIGELAQRIQDGAPFLKDSHSAFKERGVMAQYSDRIMAAVREWNAKQAGASDTANGLG